MAHPSFKCPQCGEVIELSEALAHDLENQIRHKYEKELKQVRADEEAKLREQEKDFKRRFDEQRAHLAEREKEWEERMQAERKQLEERAKARAQEAIRGELGDLKEQLAEKERRLNESLQQELQLRKRQRELEDRERQLELETQRKIDALRQTIVEQTCRDLEEQHRLRDAEKDKRLADMSRQIDELKRKAEQGSQQLQGEVLELELEDQLRREFPFDVIEPVGKGVKGGDILHAIKTQRGTDCGRILWETKRTKTWSDSWVQKLKDDQRDCKADLAVLVSQSLPAGFHHFRQMDGVWVTDVASAMSLAVALRVILIQVARARQAQMGKQGKMEDVYNYVTGQEFRHRVEAILEAFGSLREELEKEKTAMQRIWDRRAKQIEKVIYNTGGMYADLEGLAGASLPALKILELPSEP